MDTPEYFSLLLNHWQIYAASVVFVFAIYSIVLFRYFISILDPSIISFFFSAIAGATVFFLFFLGKIDVDLFIFYLITQGAFLFGFCLFKPIHVKNFGTNKREIGAIEFRFSKWLYIIISIIVIAIQISIYIAKGIPLFAESRLHVIGNDPVFKFLKRILDISLPVYIFLTLFFLYYQKRKRITFNVLNKLNILFIILLVILSGSRGAFLTFGEAFFVYSLYSLKWGSGDLFKKLKKFTFPFLCFATVIALIVIFLGQSKGVNPFYYLLYRLAMGGDAFFMTLPNRVIDHLPTANWFIALFASPLHLLGIIGADKVPQPLGYAIMQYHNPYALFLGPNPRQNIFGYVYFGYYAAPFYSLAIGSIFGYIRNVLFFKFSNSILGAITYFLLLTFGSMLETDFQNSLAFLINIILILPPIYFLAYYLSFRKENASYSL